MRSAEIKRKTAETNIELYLNLDGRGVTNIDSGFLPSLSKFCFANLVGAKLYLAIKPIPCLLNSSGNGE